MIHERDEEIMKWDEDEFTKSVIEICEKYDFKDLFILNILEKVWWGHMIVESKSDATLNRQ